MREEDKDPATKAKEKLQQRIDMYKVRCDEFELNLRRNRIMGGVIYFDMLYIPPQPKKVYTFKMEDATYFLQYAKYFHKALKIVHKIVNMFL